MLVPVIRYLLFIYLCSLFVINLFVHCSTIYFVVVCFHFSAILCLFIVQKKKTNSDPELVFRYFDPIQVCVD